MDIIRQKLELLPEKPGVYLMKNHIGEIIYVGKAKILRNRVRSYFTGSHDGKTQQMISLINDFEYIITQSEVEALVLECNLIKKYQPKYNVLLRDDKTYPYLVITKESHPRILVTRSLKKGSGKYFGPYPNANSAREAARLLNRLFPFRKCANIPKKTCLYYHLGQCLGPCTEPISPNEYESMTKQVSSFLKGGQESIIRRLREEMTKASELFEFERAKEYRDLIDDLKRLKEKQNISMNDFTDRDVIGFAIASNLMCVQFFHIRQGKLLSRDSFIFPFFEEDEDAFISFVVQFYNDNLIPDEILIPALNSELLSKVLPVATPKKGQKQDLVNLATENAATTLHESIMLETKEKDELTDTVNHLGKLLDIPSPNLIDAFDISNTSGRLPVAGLIQFKEGRPFRSGYRKFKIHEMDQMDDTACMKQVIIRRYASLQEKNEPLPHLILVDGGKGQVNAAIHALTELKVSIPVAGIIKNDKHQTEALVNRFGQIISIDKNAPVFHLLERIQNEVHRFAITFHRQQRARIMVLSQLDSIPGIGPKRRQQLLKTFKTIEKIRNTSLQELVNAGIPLNTAQSIIEYFQKKQDVKEDNNDIKL